MEESKFKYDGENDRWLWKSNGRDATKEIEEIKAQRAEERRLYEEYAGTASRMLDNIIEFKNNALEKQKEFIEQLISNIIRKQPEDVLKTLLKKIANLEHPKHDREEINDLKYAIMQKIDECLQSKNGSFKEISDMANKCGISKDELNNCIETMIDKNNEG